MGISQLARPPVPAQMQLTIILEFGLDFIPIELLDVSLISDIENPLTQQFPFANHLSEILF